MQKYYVRNIKIPILTVFLISKYDKPCSSIASPVCQEGQSERTFLIFPFSIFPLFPIFSLFFSPFSLFSSIFANLSLSLFLLFIILGLK